MKTSVVLAMVAAIVMIELVTMDAISSASVEKRRMRKGIGPMVAMGSPRNATRNFLGGVKNWLTGIIERNSNFELSNIDDAVRI